MSTTIEELREVARAVQAGETVGSQRHRAGYQPSHSAAISTDAGTRFPSTPFLRSENIFSSISVTNVEAASIESALHGTPEPSKTGGLFDSVDLYRYVGESDWRRAVSAALSVLPVAVGTTSPALGVVAFGAREIAIRAMRAWQIERQRRLEDMLRSLPESDPLRSHAGLAAMEWLRGFLQISRERCFQISHVPSATYYAWKAKPDTVVRPNTVETLLRVTASLKLLEAALGADATRDELFSGSPTLLDQLSGSQDELEAALKIIAERAEPPAVSSSPPPRLADAASILARLRSLNASVDDHDDPRPLGSATRLDEQADAQADDRAGDTSGTANS